MAKTQMSLKKRLIHHTKSSLIYISLFILLLDFAFVGINYLNDKKTLHDTLLQEAQSNEKEFALTLQMTYRNMMQMALYISQNEELNQLFLKGKKAVAMEGGGKGGEQANVARKALLTKVKPAWDELTKAFDIRQLHYHLGPGSLSFLRVHKPHKYGDRMDDLRFIIVDTNREKTPRFGFETGRIYSGLRGVYPVFATDPETNKRVFVGSLETGTSFKQILPSFAQFFNANVAILLTKEHVEGKVWPEFIKEFFKQNPGFNYYLEGTSSPDVKKILQQTKLSQHFKTNKIQLLHEQGRYWSVYYSPLQDYQGSLDSSSRPGGFILFWSDATSEVLAFERSTIVNVIFAIIAFILIEIALVIFCLREKKLIYAEKEASIDGLTNIFNRRYFDKQFNKHFSRAEELNQPFALIMCDIDYFKQYNDAYGHQEGDIALQRVANTLKSMLRKDQDILARYGGEEFIIILPNTGIDVARRIAHDICKGVEQLKIPHSGSNVNNNLTISVGVTMNTGKQTAEEMLHKADTNLYLAKSTGRNQAVAS